jgi:hypothetical protein
MIAQMDRPLVPFTIGGLQGISKRCQYYEIALLLSIQYKEGLRNSRTFVIPRKVRTPFDLKTRPVDSAPGPERPAPNRGVPRHLNLIMNLKEILADPSISSWLKDAIKTAYEQDPVDALRDAHRLLKMLGERYTQVVNRDLAR